MDLRRRTLLKAGLMTGVAVTTTAWRAVFATTTIAPGNPGRGCNTSTTSLRYRHYYNPGPDYADYAGPALAYRRVTNPSQF